jgi:hypothetical protein
MSNINSPAAMNVNYSSISARPRPTQKSPVHQTQPTKTTTSITAPAEERWPDLPAPLQKSVPAVPPAPAQTLPHPRQLAKPAPSKGPKVASKSSLAPKKNRDALIEISVQSEEDQGAVLVVSDYPVKYLLVLIGSLKITGPAQSMLMDPMDRIESLRKLFHVTLRQWAVSYSGSRHSLFHSLPDSIASPRSSLMTTNVLGARRVATCT